MSTRQHPDTLPHQESMRSGVRVRKMRSTEKRHVRVVHTTNPRKAAA